MESIRNAIIAFIQNNPFSTASEISRNLNITRADAQYHLGLLIRGGMLVRRKQALTDKGRPAYQYQVNQNLQPDNLEGLIRVLLGLISEKIPQTAVEEITRHLFAYSDSQPQKPQSIHRLIHKLNQLGYDARWEAATHGPKIILRNCPYKSLAASEPVLCQVDRKAIETHLGLEYWHSSKLFQAGGKDSFCAFIVKPLVHEIRK